jgi:hypothetical protein
MKPTPSKQTDQTKNPAGTKSMPPKPMIKEPDTQKEPPKEASAPESEFGEGNYKATRAYNDGLRKHLETSDVEREARDAAPRSKDEERDMERAEETGRSRARDTEPADPNG